MLTDYRYRALVLACGPRLCALAGGLLAPALQAQSPVHGVAAVERLPEYSVSLPQVANQTAMGGMDMPVSGLRFEPRVDVQGRNLGEAQADVAIRGGTFENTGFKLGALSLYDPQTGHYFAEIPVSPTMLGAPVVLTGAQNAFGGFNATVGTIEYGWRKIGTRGELSASAGTDGYNRQSFYQGAKTPPVAGTPAVVAADVEWARSESDGTVPFGEHDFQRAGARLQLLSPAGQTDVYGGYQSKFFGWPNLYTPFGFNETENLQTVLLAANHRWTGADGDFIQAGAYYRRNKDDYEFNRAAPGASNPFQHTAWTRGAALEGRRSVQDWKLNYSLAAMQDDLRSTSLVFGSFNQRTFFKAGVLPERRFDRASGALTLKGGLTYDEADHGGAAFSPIVSAEWQGRDRLSWRLEYSEATQLPTYTALKSSATAGLFRGNAALGRERSRNAEIAVAKALAGWTVSLALFRRGQDDMVDWTFRRGVTARTAAAVDLQTTGAELIASRRGEHWDLVLGYTALQKDADYGSAGVDASFYALNFPRHRLTAALTWRFARGWELRSDNELRVQEDNLLRTAGGDEALLSSVGLYFQPAWNRRLEFSLLVDNLWDSNYQEVPAVPAGRRHLAVGATLRW